MSRPGVTDAERELATVLSRYDDAAWESLANRGLLRRARKDLESVRPHLLPGRDGEVQVEVGDAVVRFVGPGPASAVCSCPSPTVCRHVVAAGLWFAGRPDEAAATGVDEPADLHDELMALDAAALIAHAGISGYRWAHHALDDADVPPDVSRGVYLAVRFGMPAVEVRYLGGGLPGLLVDAPVRDIERYRVAAVLAWQRAHGRVLPPPPGPVRAPNEAEQSMTASRGRLRGTVIELLQDLVEIGVSHPSPALQDRLVTAAVWAQGVEYHRLARGLRRLADEVDLLVVRSSAADDLRLLDELAQVHALATALDVAARAGTAPPALVGRARADFDDVRRLELVGLGCLPWRSGSGYHGLTCVFWSPTAGRMLTWTDARPSDVAGFDPLARPSQPGPWPGVVSPAHTVGTHLLLTGARVSAGGRISGSGVTSALVDVMTADDMIGVVPVVDRWSDLAPSRPAGLLDPAEGSSAWTVLRPTTVSRPVWDASSQLLRWELVDAVGDRVLVQLPWSRANATAIGRLESLGELPSGTCVVARVRRAHGEVVAEPLSLVRLGDDGPGPIDALHLGSAGASTLVGAMLAAAVPDRLDDPDAASAVPAAVGALRTLVERLAQRGTAGADARTLRTRVADAHTALRDVGFTLFVAPDPSTPPADQLLRSLYLVQQVERALR
ncbi:hypothetical protein [Cellulomonas sp. HZM]|uniref:hypothetical protein n=1 Tax=Cellulomonas sp. HZM TaxID=1454010 RepID=UPI000B150B96|nr:hypothetical protein [Cellulomonas sp. HZM]